MWRRVGFIVLVVFAVIGVGFTAVFTAMQFGWLNVRGSADSRDQFYAHVPQVEAAATVKPSGTPRPVDPLADCVGRDDNGAVTGTCDWNNNSEWRTVRGGLMKDAAVIADVSDKTGVPARLIAAAVIPEQLRFFTSERETFKKFFEPLKVLGTMSKFSLGVSGIKFETAQTIEKNLYDPGSPFYPGDDYAALIAYSGSGSHDTQLYDRLTDSRNHYYAYLYTAIYLKEISAQWQHSGYDLADKPGISATLFNIGFAESKPNADPHLGGSVITLNNTKYTFGELGQRFYDSGELVGEFSK